jgi:hypothetical protein
MESISINGNIISVGDTVNIKNDEVKGTVKEIKSSGHFETYRKYDLMIQWQDDNTIIRTPMQHFDEVMEKTIL